MSTETDISFCDTCELRGVIGPDLLCAREALAFAQEISQYLGPGIEVDPVHETVTVTPPGEAPYSSLFLQETLRCIESVSHGGRPMKGSEE